MVLKGVCCALLLFMRETLILFMRERELSYIWKVYVAKIYTST